MADSENETPTPDGLARFAAALRGLRYGTATAVVQDGVVVQVERTEKIRLVGRATSRRNADP
jgi:hypothetical protein